MLWIFLVLLLFTLLFLLARAHISLKPWLGMLTVADVALMLTGMSVAVGVLILCAVIAAFVFFTV